MSDGMIGKFVWHELMTTDAKAAAGFYSKVAKLRAQPAPFDKTYTMFVGSDRPMGGMMVVAGDAPSWLSYIGTRDVDETTRKAESLGARVVKAPAPVADGGRFAILQDPQGAAFAIYSHSGQSGEAPSEVPLGHSSWHELATSDHAAAFSFYQQLFGWHTTSSMDSPQGVYRMFGPAGAKDPFGAMYTKGPEAPGGPNWLPYIKVADARPATKTAKSSGAKILTGPMQVPGGGWISMGIDPQGAMFAVHSVAAAAPTKKKAAPAKRKAASKPKGKAAKKTTKKKAAKKKAAKKKAAPRRAKKKAGSKK